MTYREQGVQLDLSSSGRGLQQTLLLLAFMYANPGSVLLLDEPDAHLEILRQRQIYGLLTEVAGAAGSQIIAASHSEVLLAEAAGRDMVVAFVGQPYRIDDRGSQVLKALKEIGYDQYIQAEQTGWVLYLEGATDLALLKAFAQRLDHQGAIKALEQPFVHYAGNQPQSVNRHSHGLREAIPISGAVALFDRFESDAPDIAPVECLVWKRREIRELSVLAVHSGSLCKHRPRRREWAHSFPAPEAENRLSSDAGSHRGSSVRIGETQQGVALEPDSKQATISSILSFAPTSQNWTSLT